MKSKEQARVVHDCMTDGSLGYNVEYTDSTGFPMLVVGCIDEAQAEELAEILNESAWVRVDSGETVGS